MRFTRLEGAAALGAAMALLGFCAPAAQATVLVEVPIEDMAADADAIVLATVEEVGVYLVRRGGMLEAWTRTTLQVREWLAGEGGATVDVHEPGGEWLNGGTAVAGAPRYAPGERVLVFLWRDPQGRMRTYGMVQGRFVIQPAVRGVPETVSRDFDHVGLVQHARGAGRPGPARPEPPLQLEELLRLVRGVIEVTR